MWRRSWPATWRQGSPRPRSTSTRAITRWALPSRGRYLNARTEDPAELSVPTTQPDLLAASLRRSVRHELEFVLHDLVHRVASTNRRDVHGVFERPPHRIDQSGICGEDAADPF